MSDTSNEKPAIPVWETTTRKVVAENRFLTLEEHHREEVGTGRDGNFFILNTPSWVNIVALTERDEIILIEQFRHGSEQIELEIPGGTIDEGESPDAAILRELTEETGFEMSESSEFRKIGEVIPNPAFIRNLCYTYLVTNVRPTGKVNFGEHENIRVVLAPRREIDDIIRAGKIKHSLVIAAVYWMRLAGY